MLSKNKRGFDLFDALFPAGADPVAIRVVGPDVADSQPHGDELLRRLLRPGNVSAAKCREVSAESLIDVSGFWRDEAGSVLRFRKHKCNQIDVTGMLLNERVKGNGHFEGDKLKIDLISELSQVKSSLSLDVPPASSESECLRGTASDGDGKEREISFSLMAMDVEGTWKQSNDSSLLFGEPVLDYCNGEPQVLVEVKGCIFQRCGKGRFEISGRNLWGRLDATDWSRYDEFYETQVARDIFVSDSTIKRKYRNECQKEGWWGADDLWLSLSVCPQGKLMSGSGSTEYPVIGKAQIELRAVGT
jgi:hypothetical protein